ncbi:MAG: hypothetical protein ACRENI_01955 [Gemmatimonadaceae bacterium]
MTALQLVDRERSALRVAMAAAGMFMALATAAVMAAVGTLSLGGARWIARPSAPIVVWIAIAVTALAIVCWTYVLIGRRASRNVVAMAVERELALRSGSLRGALEVAAASALGRQGARLMAERLAADAGDRPLAPLLRRRILVRSAAAAFAAILAFGLLAAARAAEPGAWLALSHPLRTLRGTLLPPLSIVNPPPDVLRGERVGLRIAAPGRPHVTALVRSTGEEWRTLVLVVRADTAVADLGPVDADITIVATDGHTASDTALIRVTDRPFVGDVALRAVYPRYLGRAQEALPLGERARLPRGTVVAVTGRASTELESVRLVSRGDERATSDTILMRVDGRSFSGRIVASAAGSTRYAWEAEGTRSEITDVPPALELDVVADSMPRIEFLSPVADTIVASSDRVTLRIAASDDHGLLSVDLRSARRTRTGREQPAMVQRLAAVAPSEWRGDVVVDLSVRGLEAGDAVTLVGVAVDNSPWEQRTESRPLLLRIPTLAERRQLARDAADSALAHIAAAAEAQRGLERRTEEAARSRGDRAQQSGSDARRAGGAPTAGAPEAGSMSYEAAEQARGLVEEQRELAESVERAAEAAADLERQLREAGVLDTALAQRLREARLLLQEALTPELEAQLRELEDALQRLDGDDARDQLSNLAEQQRRLREKLERSVEMLRRAALEGMMETLSDEARELAAAERALADSLSRGAAESRSRASDSTTAAESRALSKRSAALTSDVGELAARLEREGAEAGAAKAREAEAEAGASTSALRDAEQEAASSGGENAADAAGKAADAMARAADALSQARAQQVEAWKSELTDELDRAIQELLQLGREQQELGERAGRGAEPGSLRSEQSAIQQGVQKTAERLDAESRKSSLLSGQAQGAVSEAQQQVADATEAAAEGRSGELGEQMRNAAEALNRAAAALVRDRERAARASSASGFSEMLERLRELARQQGGLNAQASGLMQLPLGQSAEASAAARELARQQRALARQLEELGDATGNGRARELAAEARRIAATLEQGIVDATTLARQQQLFRRLLDAGRTLEQDERDETGKRESEVATGTARFSPASEAASGAEGVRFREPTWDDLRGLSPEERRAVLEYFRRINAGSP